MNESKVVRYTPEVVHKTVGTGVSYGVAEMREREHGIYVTHADYKALEDELAALRGKLREIVEADIAFNRESVGHFVVNAASERRRLALESLS